MGKMYMLPSLGLLPVDLPSVTDCHLCRHFRSRAGKFSFDSAYALRPTMLTTGRSLTEEHARLEVAEQLMMWKLERVPPYAARYRFMHLP